MKCSLSALPCFVHVDNICAISSGLSQHCFTVHADNKVYFAKTSSSDTETQVALSAAKQKLGPAVLYHDQHWLITDFINSENLAQSAIEQDTKSNYAITLMAQCHQLNVQPPKLDPNTIIHDLITQGHYSAQQQHQYFQRAALMLPTLKSPQALVCCHGDVNFSNVLLDQKSTPWLIDYECACSAPAEFDLAMFIAINAIAEHKITMITKRYEIQRPAVSIDRKRLYHYLAFSYFINSLWYANAYQSRNDIELLNAHQQQWQKLISLMAQK